MPRTLFTILLLAGPLHAAAPPAGDYALKDGDTVVFLGDSITAARTYGKIVEEHTLLRFPDRRVRFHNAGRGGDTAAGGLERLGRDVFPLRPTVLIVAYGVNDIGWGLKADAEHRGKYLDAVRGIVAACRKRGVRVFLCSASITAQAPDRAEGGFLQKMCDDGMALARDLGERSIDVQRSMRAIQRRVLAFNEKVTDAKHRASLHAADGVHLNDLGQLAMAYAILKGLGAPADVSSVRLDASSPMVVASSGCKIEDLTVEESRVTFTRRDEGLPLNRGLFYALNYRFVPVPDGLNRYLLAIDGLPEGRYEVTADGRGVGTFTARQLAAGVNLASATADAWQPGGPWDAQASVVQALTDARHHLAVANVLANAYLERGTLPRELAEPSARTDDELVAQQRLAARPRPYRFEVRPARDTFVYVSVADEKRIAVYRMDQETGELAHRSDVKLDGEPGALVVSPDRRFLFAALRSTGKLASFRIDRATGTLTHLGTVPAGPDPAHISTAAAGRYLLTASYVDAKVTVHAIGKDGSLGEKPLQSIPTADKAHAIVADPTGRFVFVPHTGPDVIFQFTFDAKTGRLSPNSPAKVETPKKSGPRHLVFHPSKPIAYVDNEQASSVTAYALDEKAGTLKPLETVSTLPADFKGTNACAEIRVHPSGRFAYASNRGHDSIAVFALGEDGKLSVLGQVATEKTPRSFDIDPAGRYLFAAGESSGKVAGYRIDPKTGKLTRSATYDVGKTPWWVLAVDVPMK